MADDLGGGALGGELVGDRPARRGAADAETLLQGQRVDLVDDAVDVVGERRALRLDLGIDGERLGDAGAAAHQRIDREAPFAEGGDDAELGVGRQRAASAPQA